MAEYVHRDVTVVVGTDEETKLTVVFLVKKTGGMAISFPRDVGMAKELSAADMDLFLMVTPPSEMLDAIREAWQKVQPQ